MHSNTKAIEHIAIMMDGNGRWARKRGLPRKAGHYAGMETMRRIIADCNELNLKYVTLYAFSSENWTRPQGEVDYILSLPQKLLDRATMKNFHKNNVKVKFIGDVSKFSSELKQLLSEVEDQTKLNTGLHLNFALNYGGRNEILHAVKELVAHGLDPMEVTPEVFESYLYTHGMPSPELVIRTSGEERLSNFLLWQSSHAELWFTDTLWPDFNKALLLKALNDYQLRSRDKH